MTYKYDSWTSEKELWEWRRSDYWTRHLSSQSFNETWSFLHIYLHPTWQTHMKLGRKKHPIITTLVDWLCPHTLLMRTDVVQPNSLLSQPNKVVILSHFLLSNVVTSTEWWSAKCTQGRQFWGWDCQCLGDQSNLQRAHTHQTSQHNVLPSNLRPGVLAQTEKKSNPCLFL